jgi:hypothetical protein
LEDGRAYFQGTAYFRRLDDLDIEDQMPIHFTWQPREDGTRVLGASRERGVKRLNDFPDRRKPGITNLTEADLAKHMRDERLKYQALRPMLDRILGQMRHEATFVLPGRVTSSSIFVSGPKGELRVVFAGTNLMVAMDKIINDDVLFKQALLATNRDDTHPEHREEEINERIFGLKAPLQAIVAAASKPQFDYAAEVRAARSDFAKLQEELEVSVPVIAPALEAAFKNLQVVGVEIVSKRIKAHDFGAWSQPPVFTLSLLGEFPGRVESLTENCVLETALCDDGSSLLPTESWRKIEALAWSEDRTAVRMRLRLNEPSDSARTLKELSGRVQFRSEAEWREIDLGFSRITDGVQGTELGASIGLIRREWDDGQDMLELNLALGLGQQKNVYLVVNGVRTKLKCTSVFGGQDRCRLLLMSRQRIPAEGRLVVEVPGKLQNFNVPFKLQNIRLPKLSSEFVR